VEISARIIIKRFPLGSSMRVRRVVSIYHLLTEKQVNDAISKVERWAIAVWDISAVDAFAIRQARTT
jgi:hypothetical protein